jgi:glutamate dehydrogenase
MASSTQAKQVQTSASKKPAPPADLARAFVKRFFATISGDDLLPPEEKLLKTGAERLLIFAMQRAKAKPLIAVSDREVMVVTDDMPFLVDSVTSCLKSFGLTLERVIHPIVPVLRDGAGVLTGIGGKGGGHDESMIYVALAAGHENFDAPAIARQLQHVLEDVRLSVLDWSKMLALLDETAAGLIAQKAPRLIAENNAEAAACLEWLKADHFTFLGARIYGVAASKNGPGKLTMVEGSGLGMLRDTSRHIMDETGGYADGSDIRNFLDIDDRLVITKTRQMATVHHRVPMDAVAVKDIDEKGRTRRLILFVGVFTHRAYNRAARDIPFLRRKVGETLAKAGFGPSSHNGKLMATILDTYPRDELFQMTTDELLHASLRALALEKRPHFSVFARPDRFGNFLSLMIYMPRERYNYELRQRLEGLCETTVPGEVIYSHGSSSAGDQLVRIHIVLAVDHPQVLKGFDSHNLERALGREASNWTERLRQSKGPGAGLDASVFELYQEAFPLAYREVTLPDVALADIMSFEALPRGDAPRIRLSRPGTDEGSVLLLTLYRRGGAVALSDLVPILEKFGLRVLTESAYTVEPHGREPLALQVLAVDLPPAARKHKGMENLSLLAEAFDAVWAGLAESDRLNQLVILEGLTAGEIAILRAYAKYLRQARFRFSETAIETALTTYPGLAGCYVKLFKERNDPDNKASDQSIAETEASIEAALEAVSNADDDAILRAFGTLIRATLRTNYFQDKPVLSFKLDSRALGSLLPPPRPMVEIFVYSARMEAVHLRGGRIARGGIRWSDRREDFRTEILGLMKAQMVKNTVIVPVGSKGGFVLKKPPAPSEGRAALMQEGIACYKLMMQGLLDVTDNLDAAGKIVAPPRTVRHDGDDPYLVVAADKGTATFSDIANGISQDYGFWLDDAFASGGSSGYDHKKMGITAKGAWESVKRHFREIAVDVQKDPVTVVGVGDMSGDVFGNGMLLSKSLKLIAAFDHRHIFLDPAPDAARSYAERRRLFDLPTSSWADYNPKAISRGGGVFPRSLKTIPLSPEIRQALDIQVTSLSPTDLMQAILKAPVDLLFFGGIGTYIKAAHESHADAGDRANDSSRVDGYDVRARVIAEGANLGVTQQGRIEYAARGGRLNTDFIDNSAGVDTSDHEVNIKILTKKLVDRKKLTIPARDKLLASMTDEIAALVLNDNYQQTQALSRMEARAAQSFDADVRYLKALEKKGHLDRVVEFLPDDEELTQRAAAGRGLTRPELAVLLAYSKITTYDRLIQSDFMPHDFDAELLDYFPKALQQQFAAAIKAHPLKREIVMTRIVNALINRVGPTFLHDMETRTGAGIEAVVKAFIRARGALDLPMLWESIEALDGKVPATLQTEMNNATELLLRRIVPRALATGTATFDVKKDRAAVAALTATLSPAPVAQTDAPAELAQRLALLSSLTPIFDLVSLAASTGFDMKNLAGLYAEISQRFGLSWLAETALVVPCPTSWERRAADAMVDEAFDLAQALVRHIAARKAKMPVQDFIEHNAVEVARLDAVTAEAMAASSPSIPLLTLVAGEARRLAHAVSDA